MLPAQEPTISGFYGWGVFLTWSLALIATILSGCVHETWIFHASTRFRLARWLSWIPLSPQDTELLATLAVPIVAAADINIRRQRVSFHQVFVYSHPSFVPASDGDDLAADILTIRAALVIVSHFTWFSALLSFAWLSGGGLNLSRRRLFGAAATVITHAWCIAAVQPLCCSGFASQLAGPWVGHCDSDHSLLVLHIMASACWPGVTCGGNRSVWSVVTSVLGGITFASSLGIYLSPRVTVLRGSCLEFLLWCLFIFPWFALVGLLVILPIFFSLSGAIFAPFWYMRSYGRQCTFGPSSMIGFTELDQIFSLAVGGFLALLSIWHALGSIWPALRRLEGYPQNTSDGHSVVAATPNVGPDGPYEMLTLRPPH